MRLILSFFSFSRQVPGSRPDLCQFVCRKSWLNAATLGAIACFTLVGFELPSGAEDAPGTGTLGTAATPLRVMVSGSLASPTPIPAPVANAADVLAKSIAAYVDDPRIKVVVVIRADKKFLVRLSGKVANEKEKQHAGDRANDFSSSEIAKLYNEVEVDSKAKAPKEKTEGDDQVAAQRVQLFYLRNASGMATVLGGLNLEGLKIQALGAQDLVLDGPLAKRRQARRIIAALDVPLPSLNMEMWGVQFSSDDPQKLDAVLEKVHGDIDASRVALQATFREMQKASRINDKYGPPYDPSDPKNDGKDPAYDRVFRSTFENDLDFTTVYSNDRPLSLVDVLFRLVAAKNPGLQTAKFANQLQDSIKKIGGSYSLYLGQLKGKQLEQKDLDEYWKERVPFRRFFESRGITYDTKARRWEESDNVPLNLESDANHYAMLSRVALIDFSKQYATMIEKPSQYSPYYFQQSADTLNGRLQYAVSLLSGDIYELFTRPTLDNIQLRAREFKQVKYAQVGSVNVQGLSGVTSKVQGTSMSTLSTQAPLTLQDYLAKAKGLSDALGDFIPDVTTGFTPGANGAAATAIKATRTVGTLPISQLAGLLAAQESMVQWREIPSGISMDVTPNVLRNGTSAELGIVLKVGEPAGATAQAGVPALTRVSQHTVESKVNVNTLDIFDLSNFDNQSTLDGGRRYFPIIGPVWKSIFEDVPGIGKLFSWRKGPKSAYHRSLVLTNTIIVPSAMDIAALYPIDPANKDTDPHPVPKAVAHPELELLPFDYEMFDEGQRQTMEGNKAYLKRLKQDKDMEKVEADKAEADKAEADKKAEAEKKAEGTRKVKVAVLPRHVMLPVRFR